MAIAAEFCVLDQKKKNYELHKFIRLKNIFDSNIYFYLISS